MTPVEELAQQRPGPKPRQHTRYTVPTRPFGNDAQQRPGPKPRQHRPRPASVICPPTPLNKGRDRSPGNTNPQTVRPAARSSLNKGRDRSPGNTPRVAMPFPVQGDRSTKAGTEAPATRPPLSLWPGSAPCPLNKGRDRSPGNTTDRCRWRPMSSALNKGRDRSPGNTQATGETPEPHVDAQQRPGPKPRQHPVALRAAPSTRSTLNKGRDRSPGNTGERGGAPGAGRRAQQRPGPKPRQHFHFAVMTVPVPAAQQRPGPKPRQHRLPELWSSRND